MIIHPKEKKGKEKSYKKGKKFLCKNTEIKGIYALDELQIMLYDKNV